MVKYEKLDVVNGITLLWETLSPKESSAVTRTAERQCCYSKRATEFAASWSFVLPPGAPRLGWWYMCIIWLGTSCFCLQTACLPQHMSSCKILSRPKLSSSWRTQGQPDRVNTAAQPAEERWCFLFFPRLISGKNIFSINQTNSLLQGAGGLSGNVMSFLQEKIN